MKVSLNTLQNLVGFDLPPVDELVARINAHNVLSKCWAWSER